jgi:hypothetical protein
MIGFAFLTHHVRTADRTMRRHGECPRVGRPSVRQHRHDFGNHVTRAAHDDGIADVHILAPDLVFVVQRGVGHRHPAHEHRRQPRHRRQLAGTADLHLDVLHRGERFLRRILVRDRPARLARDEAELLLQRDAVHLVDDSVDVERQRRPDFGNRGGSRPVPGRRCTPHGVRRQAVRSRQRVEHAGMRRRHIPAPRFTQPIGKKRQRTPRSDGGIELADAAGCSVARIDQRAFAHRECARVEGIEVVAPHIDFAAHFEHLGHVRRIEKRPWLPAEGSTRPSGMSRMVRTFCVTSSPVSPSPRVAARTRMPFS